jgi:3-methyladenine DNA glycosylase Tag
VEHAFSARINDRVVANARVIRGAPEAVALTVIITLGLCYFAFQHFHRERVAALNDRILSQERLLIDYRAKLKGTEAAAAQIEKLTSSLAAAQESLRQAKTTPVSIEKQSRDPRRLYDGNSPIALTQDPKVDLEKKKITFPIVNAAVILATNKEYEFHDWKLACGGTQMYNMVNDGAAREFSYSPLTCRIVGNR